MPCRCMKGKQKQNDANRSLNNGLGDQLDATHAAEFLLWMMFFLGHITGLHKASAILPISTEATC